jgi:hypothetical protein
MNPIQDTEPFILVEGPKWADAEFYGRWLLMASKAQALWKNALKFPDFEKRMDLMTVLYLPDFELSASLFLFQLENNLVSFTIRLFGNDSNSGGSEPIRFYDSNGLLSPHGPALSNGCPHADEHEHYQIGRAQVRENRR